VAGIDSHQVGVPGPAVRYAGIVTSGLPIDRRHLGGLGPAYGAMPAIASEAEAWSRAARADAGSEVALRGLGGGFGASNGIARVGLPRVGESTKASCCDDCGTSKGGGCASAEKSRDDSAALKLGNGVEHIGLEYYDVPTLPGVSSNSACGGCGGGCNCSGKNMPAAVAPTPPGASDVLPLARTFGLPSLSPMSSTETLQRAASTGLTATPASRGRFATLAAAVPAASVVQTPGQVTAAGPASARDWSAAQAGGVRGAATPTRLSAQPSITSMAPAGTSFSSQAYAGALSAVGTTAAPASGTTSGRFRLPSAATSQPPPSAAATLYQASSTAASAVASFGRSPTTASTGGPLSAGSSPGTAGPAGKSQNFFAQVQPGGVEQFGKRVALDSFLQFAVEFAVSQPKATEEQVFWGALQKLLERQIPVPARDEFPDPDLFRAIIAVARRRRRPGADAAFIAARYQDVVAEAEREPLHVEPALVQLYRETAVDFPYRWKYAWKARLAQGTPLPTPPDRDLLFAIYRARPAPGQTTIEAAHDWYFADLKLFGKPFEPHGYPLYCEPALLNYIVYFALAAPDLRADDVYKAALYYRSLETTRPWRPTPEPNLNLRRKIIAVARRREFTAPRDILNVAVAELLELSLERPDRHIESELLEALVTAARERIPADPWVVGTDPAVAPRDASVGGPDRVWSTWWRAVEARRARDELPWPPSPLPDEALVRRLVQGATAMRHSMPRFITDLAVTLMGREGHEETGRIRQALEGECQGGFDDQGRCAQVEGECTEQPWCTIVAIGVFFSGIGEWGIWEDISDFFSGGDDEPAPPPPAKPPKGARFGECRDDGSCDPGLACQPNGTCGSAPRGDPMPTDPPDGTAGGKCRESGAPCDGNLQCIGQKCAAPGGTITPPPGGPTSVRDKPPRPSTSSGGGVQVNVPLFKHDCDPVAFGAFLADKLFPGHHQAIKMMAAAERALTGTNAAGPDARTRTVLREYFGREATDPNNLAIITARVVGLHTMLYDAFWYHCQHNGGGFCGPGAYANTPDSSGIVMCPEQLGPYDKASMATLIIHEHVHRGLGLYDRPPYPPLEENPHADEFRNLANGACPPGAKKGLPVMRGNADSYACFASWALLAGY
jgi:hypothetical protein